MATNDTPYNWSLNRVRGNPLQFSFMVYDANRDPLVLTGFTFGMPFANNQYFTGTGSYYVTEGNGMTIDRPNGIVSVDISADVLDDFPIYSPMFFKINIEEPGEDLKTYIVGSLTNIG